MGEVSTGASIAFQSGFFSNNVVDITERLSRPPVPMSHMGSTVLADFKPAKLITAFLDVVCLYDTQDIPIRQDPEAITVTVEPTITWVFDGFIIDSTRNLVLEDRRMMQLVIQLTGSGHTGII